MWFQRIIFKHLIKQGPWSNANQFFWRGVIWWRWSCLVWKGLNTSVLSTLIAEPFLKFWFVNCTATSPSGFSVLQRVLAVFTPGCNRYSRHAATTCSSSLSAFSARPHHYLCLGCNPQQWPAAGKHVFSQRIWKLNRQRLHSQTAGHYLCQPKDFIISAGEVQHNLGMGDTSSTLWAKWTFFFKNFIWIGTVRQWKTEDENKWLIWT